MDALSALHPDGVFLRREALDFGLKDRDLRAAVAAGVLARVRHGAYVDSERWSSADELGRHLLRARAVMLTHSGPVALSHVSGAALHGLRVWGSDLTRVHVTRLDGQTARRMHDVVHHCGGWSADEVVECAGLPVLSVRQCALGTAMTSSVEGGLVTLDSAYEDHALTRDALSEIAASMGRWPGAARLQITLRLAEPGSQSVGESRTRYLCWATHLPKPVLQYSVFDRQGRLVGTTDFAWPDRGLLGEFDGRVKYGRYLRPGESPGDAVFREKIREDQLRELTNWSMVRLVWADLDHKVATADRIRRMMAPRRALRTAY